MLGRWELDRGPQELAYDFWWHLGYDTMVSSEWGTPDMFEDGLIPEILLSGGYGHKLHVWDLLKRRHVQEARLRGRTADGARTTPAHDPTRAYGFAGVVVSRKDLSASIWVWYRDNGRWAIKKVIEIPAEPADPADLPPLLQGFKAVPPLITDINLSLDDRFLYVSCFGTGEFLQYDVSDPLHPENRIGARGWNRPQGRASQAIKAPLNGAPQMVEISRDGTPHLLHQLSLHSWDAQFYPEGIKGWMVKLDAKPEGGIEFDEDFFLSWPDGYLPHWCPARRRCVLGFLLLSMTSDRSNLANTPLPGHAAAGYPPRKH